MSEATENSEPNAWFGDKSSIMFQDAVVAKKPDGELYLSLFFGGHQGSDLCKPITALIHPNGRLANTVKPGDIVDGFLNDDPEGAPGDPFYIEEFANCWVNGQQITFSSNWAPKWHPKHHPPIERNPEANAWEEEGQVVFEKAPVVKYEDGTLGLHLQFQAYASTEAKEFPRQIPVNPEKHPDVKPGDLMTGRVDIYTDNPDGTGLVHRTIAAGAEIINGDTLFVTP